MVALPRLRTDLHVEARSDVHGAYYRLTNADSTRSHRLSQPAYMALSMLDGRFGWEQWSAAVQTIYPQVTPAHMTDLLREVAAMGFLDGDLVLPQNSAATPAAPPAAQQQPPAPPPQPSAPAGGPTMLSDLEAGFNDATQNVPLEVTGIRQALDPGEMKEGLGAEIAANAELDPTAFDALFSGTDDTLRPQPTQISPPPSEMEDPYLRELGPQSAPQPPAQVAADDVEEPGATEEVRLALASDDLASDLSSEPPAPPEEISNPQMVAPTPLPEPPDLEGLDVQFTDHALPALPRDQNALGYPELSPDGSAIDGLPVAMGMESTEGAALLEADLLQAQPTVVGASQDGSVSDVSTTVVVSGAGATQAANASASQDAIPTATDVGAPIEGQPKGHPIAGALPPFDFDPQSNPENPPIPGPSGSAQAPIALPGNESPSRKNKAAAGTSERSLPGPESPDEALAALEAFEDAPELSIPQPASPGPSAASPNHDPFDNVDSRERPKAHENLKSGPSGEVGLLSVENPEGKTFKIYELEHQLLQLLDGEKDLTELREIFGKMGHPVNEQQLASFIRQMNAYGFLESTGPIVPASSLPPQMPWKEGPPQQADAIDQWPAEERRLFQQGLTHFRDGNYGRAEGYFNALLEINADNPEAQAMLAMMAESPQVQAATAEPEEESKGSSGRTAFLFMLLLTALIAGAGMAVERPVTSTAEVVIQPAPAATIQAPVDGVVAELLVDTGQPVKKNGPLVRLEAEDLLPEEAANKAELAALAQEIALLESTDEARAEMAKEFAAATKEQRALTKQKKKLDRASRRGSRRSRKSAAEKAKALEAPLEEATQKVTALKSKVETANKGKDPQVVQAAKDRLDEAKKKEAALMRARAARQIPSPFAGVVESYAVAVGDALVTGGNVATVAREGVFRSEVLVPEKAMQLVEKGGYINVRMTAFPDATFPGKTVEVAEAVDIVDDERVVRVQVELRDDTGRLKPRMSGTVAFQGTTMPVTMIVWQKITGWLKLNFVI